MHRSKTASLFDHLVSAQQEPFRNRETERLRCREVDDQLNFGGLLGQ
jgi:hypothetical protein